MSFTDVILAPFRLPVWQTALLSAAVGALLTAWFTRRALRECHEADRGWPAGAALAGAVLCGAFAYCMLTWKVQETPNVRPSEVWWYWRIGHHVMLISLMLAATATDLRAYLIPDRVVRFGLLWGIAFALLSGDLQIEHVWVDWNEEIPQFRGPYIPDWLALHPHWHGLAWSLAGAACGAFGTELIRSVASRAMGQEAMGMGDVTLMAMIGAFLGWQATLVALLFAPLCGLAVGAVLVLGRAVAGAAIPAVRSSEASKSYLPYGPFLCLAAYLVLMTWRWIWMFELHLAQSALPGDRLNTFAVRRLFGDWLMLLLLAGVTLAALAVALFLRRLYKNLPVQRRSGAADPAPSESPATGSPPGFDQPASRETAARDDDKSSSCHEVREDADRDPVV